MTASELDFATKTWLLPAERTKAGREHLVPLTDLAIDLLSEAQGLACLRHKRMPEGADPIFPSPRDSKKPVERISLTRAMARLTEAAKIEDATPHDLRRTGATIMASERIGTLSEVIARVLNHAPPGLGVTGIYNRHAYVAEKRRALQLWAQLLLSIATSTPRPSNIVEMKAANA